MTSSVSGARGRALPRRRATRSRRHRERQAETRVVLASSQHAACGTLTTYAATASQAQPCRTTMPIAATSAIAMNTSELVLVPASTRTGARSEPTIPIPAISCEFQRTAVASASAPTAPATTRPTDGDTRW